MAKDQSKRKESMLGILDKISGFATPTRVPLWDRKKAPDKSSIVDGTRKLEHEGASKEKSIQALLDVLGIIPGPGAAAKAGTAAVAGIIGGGHTIKGAEAALRAQKMLHSGVPAEEVFKLYGIYPGPLDGKLRAIISDEKMKLTPKFPVKEGQVVPFMEAVDHPEFMRLYPDLSAELSVVRKAGPNSSFSKKENLIKIGDQVNSPLSDTVHELQHGVQADEWFTGGSNRSVAWKHKDFPAKVTEIVSDMASGDRIKRPGVSPADIASDWIYRHAGGEAEARAAQEMLKQKDWSKFPLKRIHEGGYYDVDIRRILDPLEFTHGS